MVRHIVLFRFRDDISSERVTEIMEGFGGLESEIPEIRDYSWGFNNSPEGLSHGLNAGFVMTFDSVEDRDRYLEHPEHRRYADTKARPNLASEGGVLVFDYASSK